VFFSGLGQVEGVFKLSACQQSCVRGDGRTLKLQAYLGVKANREVCLPSPMRCFFRHYVIRSSQPNI